MVKQVILILSQFLDNILYTKLEQILNKKNIRYISLNYEVLISKNINNNSNKSSNGKSFINKTSFMDLFENSDNIYLKKKLLSLWFSQNQNKLHSKDILILHTVSNIENLEENDVLIHLHDYTAIKNSTYRIIFHMNYRFIKNPYYLLTCILKLLLIQKKIRNSIYVYLENYYNITNDQKNTIPDIKSIHELFRELILQYPSIYKPVSHLLILLEKKLFKKRQDSSSKKFTRYHKQ